MAVSSIQSSVRVFCVVLLAMVLSAAQVMAQSELNVTYGPNGIQHLGYQGAVLEDLAQNPGDAFHIWHMKMTDLQGNLVTQGQYGWGETNLGRNWNPNTNTWTYNFVWGNIQVQFSQSGNALNMTVTETNYAASGVILDGATIYPFAVHLPKLPNKFYDPGYAQLSFNTTGPSVLAADYGTGEIVAVVPDASRPVYSGFMPTGAALSYYPIISTTAPDSLASFQPHNDRPVQPGTSDTFVVSLRFAPSGTSTTALASDAYASWAKTWPAQLNWKDRRPIGTVFLASSASGNINQPSGYPNNPRRYFNDSSAGDFDVTTPSGLASFQARMLQQAASTVLNLRLLGAQGMITWDIEGEQYPQNTSYVCAPDSIAQTAPEMESTISDRKSQYYGAKLDDAFFKTITSAGFRVGVCVRPQHFSINKDGTAQQTYLDNSLVQAELLRKMQFAHDHWGATLFYVDSSVESNGAVLDASIFQKLAQAFPDSLIMPEESTAKHYAYTAPFETFLFHGDLGTDSAIQAYYPQAFSVNLINDVSATTLATYTPQLTASVKSGDILMGLAGFWQANDPSIVAIYQAAGVATTIALPPVVVMPTPTPSPLPIPMPTPVPIPVPIVPTAPIRIANAVIVAPSSGQTVSGMITVAGAVNVTPDAAGSYLMVDGLAIGTHRVTGAPYSYPLDTTTLTDGAHTLQLWVHDVANNTYLSATVPIVVSNANASTSVPTPVVAAPVAPVASSYPITMLYPITGQGVSGMLQVTGLISQTLDSAASYLLVDGVENGSRRVGSAPYIYFLDTTQLSHGPHVLQIWAHDIGNNTLLSNPATIIVGN